MKASAFFQNKKYETESWLISPALDLSGKTTVTLTVEQAANFFKSMKDEIFIKISTNYKSGKPSTATWEVLTPSKWPSNDWTFVNSTVDLSAYAGKKDVRIAFQYKSTTQSAGTWELKNLVVK
ncbi:MAG: choice-of-anchor J domain-containing protein [Hoylesella buccalis]